MTESEKIKAGWKCSGCGSTETVADIKAAHPGAIACCPERDLTPPSKEPSDG